MRDWKDAGLVGCAIWGMRDLGDARFVGVMRDL